MDDEARWLAAFAEHASQDAFARLVHRHIDLVYSAALRQVKDRHLAEDVTQHVFIALWKKAKHLRRETALSAWLLVTTRYLALDALKMRARRLRHEQRAASMTQDIEPPPDEPRWQAISPHLDAAMASLSAQDRRAITLRYFDGCSVKEVADRLGISLDAAKQRVHRATMRLRADFLARGVDVSAATIGPILVQHAVQAAPAHLATTTISAAAKLAITAAAGATGTSKGTVFLMASMKAKALAASALILLIGGSAATVTWHAIRSAPRQVVVLSASGAQPTPVAITSLADAGWQERFYKVYALKPGEIIKPISKPLIPERQAFWDAWCREAKNPPWKIGEARITFEWDGTAVHWSSIGGMGTLGDAIRMCARLRSYQIDKSIPMGLEFGADWVVLKSASTEQRMDALAQVASEKLGRAVRFEKRKSPREVLVVRGTYVNHGLLDFPAGTQPAQFSPQQMPLDNYLPIFADNVSCRLDAQVSNPDVWLSYREFPRDPARVDESLAKLRALTGLELSHHTEITDVWYMADAGPSTSATTRTVTEVHK